jgi:hypothetical protein
MRSEPERRRCAICTKPLSIYNEGDVCFHHTEQLKYAFSPVTTFTSYRADATRLYQPGTEGFNELAFNKVLEIIETI